LTANVAQYVGITGLTSPAQVLEIQSMLDRVKWPDECKFMNGILVSRKTLRGLEPDNPAQYRPLSEIPDLLPSDPRFFNVIHFNSRDPRLLKQLDEVLEISDKIHAIQLNIHWPNDAELVDWVAQGSGVKLILQISRRAFDSIGASPTDLLECLNNYRGIASYVLFDPSGGTGAPYDRREAEEVLKALVDSSLPMRWGVAGGLSAERIYGLKSLLEIYPGLCWDAQSRLRSGCPGDMLDTEKCYGFLASSAALLR
jgi:hypothetical protein